jgi:putative intracellular protease/amidase
MHIAILTFEGFNELDSLIAFGILNRVKKPDWRVSIACPTTRVRSMNGLAIESQATLREAHEADAVIVGSGILTRDIIQDRSLMAEMQFDPSHQLLGAQCSGTLVLAKLGVLNDVPACTDLITKPWVEETGVKVLNQPFFARDNVATAGGCLASQYLAAGGDRGRRERVALRGAGWRESRIRVAGDEEYLAIPAQDKYHGLKWRESCLSNLADQKSSRRRSHAIASRMDPGLRRTVTTRPDFARVISPASSRTPRCFITAGSLMAKGWANSLTVALARCASLSKSARRVGSPSAAKVRSRFLVLFPIMESID